MAFFFLYDESKTYILLAYREIGGTTQSNKLVARDYIRKKNSLDV